MKWPGSGTMTLGATVYTELLDLNATADEIRALTISTVIRHGRLLGGGGE